MLKKGGIEAILTAVVLIAVVIGLIAVVVKSVAKSGDEAIQKGVENLAGNQISMEEIR